jgi:hypothetical protein
MTSNTNIILLILGGFIGWVLFFLVTFYNIKSRHQELDMINQIQKEIKIVKQEIKLLK